MARTRTRTENRYHFALHSPFTIPLTARNTQGIRLSMCGLQTYPVILLRETHQSGLPITSLDPMDDDDDVSIFASGLWLDHDVISVAEPVLNHRASFYDQGVAV